MRKAVDILAGRVHAAMDFWMMWSLLRSHGNCSIDPVGRLRRLGGL